MDYANRMRRSEGMGYSDRRYYRGDRHGDVPQEFPDGAFFSLDRDTSKGIAKLGGRKAPEEFRLNLQKAFREQERVPAESYARLVGAAKSSDPKLAADLVDQIAPGKTIEWFEEFARQHPQVTVAKSGGLVRYAIEQNARNWQDLFVRAGFDAVDFGRDVLKFTGHGIRSKNARFDPARAHERNIMASLAAILAAGGTAAANYPNQD